MDKERCSSCSKEQQDRIPIVRVISKLDDLFSRNDLSGAARLLEYWSGEADMLGDRRGKLEILSEQIGLYRRTNERDRALDAVELALKIIESEALQNSVSTGTIYVNIATTLKAFGKAKEGMPYYMKVPMCRFSKKRRLTTIWLRHMPKWEMRRLRKPTI